MNEEVGARRLRQLLFALVLVLTFEGIARKGLPSYSVPLFLLKDAIVSIMAIYVLRMRQPPALAFLWNAYKFLTVLFVVPFVVTAWHDPLLAVFGLKQYLLFPMVAFATFLAFQNIKKEVLFRFFRRCSMLVIPTALLALLQLRLPHDHWLNMSVGGESLEGFGAMGQLRVSSTFSFVAQYCAFLNAQMFIVIVALQQWRERTSFWKLVYASLIPFLVLSSFITGSRGAVVGNTTIILLAAVMGLIKFRVRTVFQIGVVIASLYFAVLAVSYFSPQTTAVYSARENGRLLGISAEIQQRVYETFFNMSKDLVATTPFGYGIGIMSNGSETFSSYAAMWRARLWTETDIASTLFEGGYYLAVIWYGFRIYVILVTVRRFLKDVTGDYVFPGAFTQGFVVVIGLLGTMGIQPPIAIWWWMGVGTSLLFWWKCVGPPESGLREEGMPLPPPKKIARGRSLYSEVLHPPKDQ